MKSKIRGHVSPFDLRAGDVVRQEDGEGQTNLAPNSELTVYGVSNDGEKRRVHFYYAFTVLLPSNDSADFFVPDIWTRKFSTDYSKDTEIKYTVVGNLR